MWKSLRTVHRVPSCRLAIHHGQISDGTLDSGIVVGGHLVGNVVVPCVIVLIIAVRATNDSSIQGLWVSRWAVLFRRSTRGRHGATARTSPVVGPEWRVDTKANHVTSASVSKDVTDLFLNERIVLTFFVPHVGQLSSKMGIVSGMPV